LLALTSYSTADAADATAAAAPGPACLQLHQRLAFQTISAIRSGFDLATGYHPDRMNEAKWLRRIIFLETVAGVPGMVSSLLVNAWCWGSKL